MFIRQITSIILLFNVFLCSPQNLLVSRGKSAVQSSTMASNIADFAVDGNSGSCSKTMVQLEPWWYVDLGEQYVIDNIHIHPAEGFEAELVGIDVRITTNIIELLTSNGICGRTIQTPSSYYIVDCEPSITGRYVSLYRDSASTVSSTLSLCEVEVYKEHAVPIVTCPDDIAVGIPISQSTLIVTWDPPAVTDNTDDNLGATCTPPSGSIFVTSTSVTCSVVNILEITGFCNFNVRLVVDDTNPVVSCPDDIIMNEIAGQSKATAYWIPPEVTDDVDPDLSANCVPPSGSSFYIGSTTVNCVAYDSVKNYGTCSFSVTVFETGVPLVYCPNDIELVTTNTHSEVVWDNPLVSDDIDAGLSATCNPSSGSEFHVGETDVTCSVIDSSGTLGRCVFTVYVVDRGSPTIKCPSDIAKNTSSTQLKVTWNDPLVTDNIDTDLSATCTPSSGSSFSVGSTDVTCTATDDSDNEGRCTFRVKVEENGYSSSSSFSDQIYIIPGIIVFVFLLLIIPACIHYCRSKQKSCGSMQTSSYSEPHNLPEYYREPVYNEAFRPNHPIQQDNVSENWEIEFAPPADSDSEIYNNGPNF